MQITEITIHPTNEDLARAYVSIVFDNCFMIREIRVMQGPTGLFVSFPAKKQRDGSHRELAYPTNAETRMRSKLLRFKQKICSRLCKSGWKNSFQTSPATPQGLREPMLRSRF